MSIEFQAYEILAAVKLNAALQEEIAARIAADTDEATTRTVAVASETAARITAVANEAAARTLAVAVETTYRINAVTNEAGARIAADNAEVIARNAAIAASAHLTVNPNINFGPVGNAFATLGSFVQAGTTTSTTLREFGGSFGLESYTGYGGVGAFGIRADKVALYAGIEGFANSADIWGFNTVTRMAPGFPSLSNALGYELDFNNEAGHRGPLQGLAGFAAPKAAGLLITGSAPYSNTAGIEVGGPTNGQWYRGIGVSSGVSQCSFFDYGTGTSGLEMQATHAWGIDMLYSALGGAIRVPNGAGLYARNAGNTADYAMMNVDATGNMEIGVTSGGTNNVLGVYMGAGTQPMVDNIYTLGSAARRWSTVYAATGTINTSDPADKTDIEVLPDSGALIDAIDPISYRWKVGGYSTETVTEAVWVQETAEITEDDFEIVVKDGTATRMPVKVVRLRDVYDTVPLLDPDGQPLIEHVPARAAQAAEYDAEGRMTRPPVKARKAIDLPMTHQIPRMIKKWMQVEKQVERPGMRTHTGFRADQLASAHTLLKLKDFGGYVVDENGKLHYRDSELSPVMWRELQSLRQRERVKDAQLATQTAQIAALLADVSALKAAQP